MLKLSLWQCCSLMTCRVRGFVDVSVIIPAYQACLTVERALESIALQTLKPKEVILVDDGSKDGTADIARNFASNMEGISLRVFCQKNLGAGAARNKAIGEAQYNLVAFLDADDEWLVTKIQRSIEVFKETNSDLVAHDFIAIDRGNEIRMHCAHHFKKIYDPIAIVFLRGNIANTTVLAKRDKIIELGGFDESLKAGQDYDLWLRFVLHNGVKFHVFEEALTKYYITSGSISSNVFCYRKYATKILEKNAFVLSSRCKGGFLIVLTRVAIIHMQVVKKFLAQNRIGPSLMSLVYAPLLVFEICGVIYKKPLVWLWIATITMFYCLQFKEYITPLTRILGLR